MALELIDGYAGTPHIDGADLAALNQGCFGAGDYVFDYGDDLKATMTTANQVTIGTGALVSKGRRAVNLSAQSLTVQSGTQGQKRNDLVVARYSKESGEPIEAMTLAVVKGTPVSYGEAADPSVTANDMKLWRIPIDGITPGTPVQLFETIPSIDSLRDSVSQSNHLYEGSWKSGRITCPGLSRYRVLMIFIVGSVTPIVGIKSTTQLYAQGSWVSSFPATHYYTFHATVEGDSLTFDYLYDTTIAANGTTLNKQTGGISGIYGVI